MTSILSNAIIAAIGRVVTILLGVVTTAIVTRYLGVVGYGSYTILLSLGIMLQMAADFGLYLTLTRDISQDGADEQAVFGNVSSLRAVLLAVWFGLGSLFLFLLPSYRDLGVPFLILAAGLSAQSFSQLLMGVYQKYKEVWKATVGDVAGRLLQLGIILSVAAMASTRNTSESVLYVAAAFLGGTVVAYGLHVWLVPGVFPLRWRRPSAQWRQLVITSWPLGALLVLNVVYFRTDALMISWFRSEAEVGWYGLAYRIVESGLFFPAMFGGLLLPRFSSAYSKQQLKRIASLLEQGVRLLVVMGVLAGGALLMFAPEIVVFLSGEEFRQSAPLLRVLSGALAVMFVGNLFGFLLVALHEQKKLLYLYAWLVVGNAIANLVLIPTFGAIAAAWTTLATECVAASVGGYLVFRKVRFRFPLKPFAGALGLFSIAGYVTAIFPDTIHVSIRLAILGVLYVAMAVVTRLFNSRDLSLLLKKVSV